MQRHVICCFLKKTNKKSNKTRSPEDFQIRVLERGHSQRKHKKEKENACGSNEKTRREKRNNR